MSAPGRGAVAARLALESAVIIASILAAFALDTWWDGVQAREEERETLTALGAEFRDARAIVLRTRTSQERILQGVAAVTDSIDRALAAGRGRVSLPDTMLGLAYIPPTTSLGLGTMRGLIASGRLGIIRDHQLRSALGAWGIELEELVEEELDSRALAFGDMDRTLRARTRTAGLWAIGNRMFQESLPPEETARRRDVPVDTQVLGVFSLRESLLRHGIDEFDALIAEIDDILALIERSMEE